MHNSLDQGLLEDGKRSIAEKILKRLKDLQKLVQHNQGRWAWELLQNARDSIIDTDRRYVSVQIQLNDSSIAFRHNGAPFTEKDLRGLINQISSKEVAEDTATKKTGRFGTGFLTTHLLSKVVDVEGVLIRGNTHQKFAFPLNREGTTTNDLIPKIDASWDAVKDALSPTIFDPSQYSTSFKYLLETTQQKEIARLGVREFLKLIPYVLVFVPLIKRVEIQHNEQSIIFESGERKELPYKINKTVNGQIETINILHLSNERVAIAIEVKKTKKGYTIAPINGIPKLFCDFPLIGTEDFHLPVVVNSFYFNPLTERDGIWLNDNKESYDNKEIVENRVLLTEAMQLYQTLLKELESMPFYDLYHLVEGRMPNKEEKYFSAPWFEKNILLPTRQFAKGVKIVELEHTESNKKSISEIWFPKRSYDTKIKEKLWSFLFDLEKRVVCKKTHLQNWCNKSWGNWNQLTYESIISIIDKYGDVEILSRKLQKSEDDTYEWLNTFYDFLFEKKQEALLNKYKCIPNDYGIFCQLQELNLDKIGDKKLIEILSLMGEDWNAILVHHHISIPEINEKTLVDITNTIRTKIKQAKDYEKQDDNYIRAIMDLTEWLDLNANAEDIFTDLYHKRASLFMGSFEDKESLYTVAKSGKLTKIANIVSQNPELIDDLEKANQITVLLKELDVNDIETLRKLINERSGNSSNTKLTLTIERIAGLGITNEVQLKEFLEDKGYEHFFAHESVSSLEWKAAVLQKIQRVKKAVLAHLGQLPTYDCTNAYSLAETVIGGVKKNGVSINIVVRPSESELIIIYYDTEVLTLDTVDTELWVENGVDIPEQITLGRIIKANRMIKIPIHES
ncbi:MAG: ATP-binding protein [Bacteroidota bacterium]